MEVDATTAVSTSAAVEEDATEDFVVQPSKTANEDASSAALPTFASLSSSASTSATSSLFSPYTFYISREVSRQTLEFVLRSFGAARVGWDAATLGAGADFTDPSDPAITHVIVDRPTLPSGEFVWAEGGGAQAGAGEDKRAFVQPQWAVDCANEGRLLPTEEYGPGKVLPPHLSPFGKGDGRGAFASDSRNAGAEAEDGAAAEEAVEEDDSEGEDGENEDDAMEGASAPTYPPALTAASLDPSNELLVHAAELEAEQLGTPMEEFEASLAKATKEAVKAGKIAPPSATAKGKKGKAAAAAGEEEDLRRIMMSNKQKKLYEK